MQVLVAGGGVKEDGGKEDKGEERGVEEGVALSLRFA